MCREGERKGVSDGRERRICSSEKGKVASSSEKGEEYRSSRPVTFRRCVLLARGVDTTLETPSCDVSGVRAEVGVFADIGFNVFVAQGSGDAGERAVASGDGA
jgi:hypothetical protein